MFRLTTVKPDRGRGGDRHLENIRLDGAKSERTKMRVGFMTFVLD